MNTKLYTYKSKNVFMLLLLAGILFSMYSCQYETVPVGKIIPIGASAAIQNNWINMRDCSWQSSLFFVILCLSDRMLENEMFNINETIEKLNKATKITTSLGEHGYKSISLSFPTSDLDISYSFYSMGNGYILRWEGMDMINEEIHFTKEDFSVLYIEVLKELMKREGEV